MVAVGSAAGLLPVHEVKNMPRSRKIGLELFQRCRRGLSTCFNKNINSPNVNKYKMPNKPVQNSLNVLVKNAALQKIFLIWNDFHLKRLK